MSDPFSFIASSMSSRSANGSAASSSQSKKNSSVDAFRDLVSLNAHSTTGAQTNNLTLAERAAKAEHDRKRHLNNDTHVFQSSFWDKYDTPAAHNSLNSGTKLPSKSSAVAVAPSFSAGQRPQTAIPAEDSWDIDFVSFDSSKPSHGLSSSAPSSKTQTNFLDSDDISPLVDFTDLSHPPAVFRSDTPGSFDFGESDERYENDGDDILGDLAKPIELVKNVASRENPPEVASQQVQRISSPNVPPSPPPHVLGKLVEMGFSIQQAKKALIETSMDVDAAVEILLRDTIDMPLEGSENITSPEQVRRRLDSSAPRPPNSKDSTQAFQEQADRLFLQASSIGLNMFNKANALWKEGREKVVKAYEEQRSGVSGVSGVSGGDRAQAKTRPRWMGDQLPDNDTRLRADPVEVSTAMYSSPARHRVSRPSAPVHPSSTILESIPSTATARLSPKPALSVSPPPPPPPATITRPDIEVSAADLATSNAAKMKGTEYFKQGRFAEAEASYSRALTALPELHLLCVPLYNNRALTRIKIGEYKLSIKDSTMVLRIVVGDLGNSWHPSRESRDGITLAQAVLKAYRRRAEAYEGLEKWEDAKTDWETLNSLSWIENSNKKDAVNGITRCRRMFPSGASDSLFKANPPASSSTAITNTKSRPVTSSAPTVVADSALSRVRAANVAQEREDQQRHELKDTVDKSLEAWRAGKEKNIRALIASLDTILPPKFNWQSVGMTELVTNNQVKVRYMRAIARLHPDKLSGSDISVEEHMIANGVFGTLNEAWNSFR